MLSPPILGSTSLRSVCLALSLPLCAAVNFRHMEFARRIQAAFLGSCDYPSLGRPARWKSVSMHMVFHGKR